MLDLLLIALIPIFYNVYKVSPIMGSILLIISMISVYDVLKKFKRG